jgi:hypothetical protein
MQIEEAWAQLDHEWCPAKADEESAFQAAVRALCHAVLEDWLTSVDGEPAHFRARIDSLGQPAKEKSHAT